MRGTIGDPVSRSPYPDFLLTLLPAIYAEDELGARLVSAFQDVVAPAIVALDNLPGYLDPSLTPPDFLHWLGEWVCAPSVAGLDEQTQRASVALASTLHATTGTTAGLSEFIRQLTGSTPQITESGGSRYSQTPGAQPPGSADPELVITVETDLGPLAEVIAAACPAHIPLRFEETGGSDDRL